MDAMMAREVFWARALSEDAEDVLSALPRCETREREDAPFPAVNHRDSAHVRKESGTGGGVACEPVAQERGVVHRRLGVTREGAERVCHPARGVGNLGEPGGNPVDNTPRIIAE